VYCALAAPGSGTAPISVQGLPVVVPVVVVPVPPVVPVAVPLVEVELLLLVPVAVVEPVVPVVVVPLVELLVPFDVPALVVDAAEVLLPVEVLPLTDPPEEHAASAAASGNSQIWAFMRRYMTDPTDGRNDIFRPLASQPKGG
jgi:hypothetical protein